MKRMEAQDLSKDYFLVWIGDVILIAGAVVAAALANFKFNFGAFNSSNGYTGPFSLGLTFILLYTISTRGSWQEGNSVTGGCLNCDSPG